MIARHQCNFDIIRLFDLIVSNVAPTVGPVVVPLDSININNQLLSVNAVFSDPAGTADETYSCTFDYGDGTGPQAGAVLGTTCTGPDQTYAQPGVYEVIVEVTDKDDGTGSATATQFIVIYDPDGGFMTGGGWIDSPTGAYTPDDPLDEDIVGKANFGFVSKYQKKNTEVPVGQTEFLFKAGNLNFHSTSYEWLIVNQGGANAQFKGVGTINNDVAPNGEPYKFMLWAGDGEPDTFRIKIWHEDAGEVVVYDNGWLTGIKQAIGGGSIVIHTK